MTHQERAKKGEKNETLRNSFLPRRQNGLAATCSCHPNKKEKKNSRMNRANWRHTCAPKKKSLVVNNAKRRKRSHCVHSEPLPRSRPVNIHSRETNGHGERECTHCPPTTHKSAERPQPNGVRHEASHSCFSWQKDTAGRNNREARVGFAFRWCVLSGQLSVCVWLPRFDRSAAWSKRRFRRSVPK